MASGKDTWKDCDTAGAAQDVAARPDAARYNEADESHQLNTADQPPAAL